MGSGASERVNKVRWHVAREMVTTWVLTIPATMAVSVLVILAISGLYRFGGSFGLMMQAFITR